MGEFNPVVGERWAGTLGENSLMGMGGEHSTGERQDLGRLQGGGFMSVTGERRREQGVVRRERFGETTMAQSVMHESNLVYDTAGDENKDEGTNMKNGRGCAAEVAGMGGQSPRARHEMRRTLGAMGRRGTASTGASTTVSTTMTTTRGSI